MSRISLWSVHSCGEGKGYCLNRIFLDSPFREITLFEQVVRCFSKSDPAVRLIVKSGREAKVCLRNNCNVICNLSQTSLITSLSEPALWAAIMRESPPRPHKWGNKAISLSLARSVVTPSLSKQPLRVYISSFFSDFNVSLFNFSK